VATVLDREMEQKIIQDVEDDVQGVVRARRVIKTYVEKDLVNGYVYKCAIKDPAFQHLSRKLQNGIKAKVRKCLDAFLWMLAIAINTKLRLPALVRIGRTVRDKLKNNLKRFYRKARAWDDHFRKAGPDSSGRRNDPSARVPRQSYRRRPKHVGRGVMV